MLYRTMKKTGDRLSVLGFGERRINEAFEHFRTTLQGRHLVRSLRNHPPMAGMLFKLLGGELSVLESAPQGVEKRRIPLKYRG